MEIAELRQDLVAMAARLGSRDPEDTAHDVLIRHLQNFEHPPKYWYAVTKNQVINEYRRRKHRPIFIEEAEWAVLEAPHDSLAEDPYIPRNADYRWLLGYYQRHQHTGSERIKAHRIRDRIRRRYAKKESRQVSGFRTGRASHRDAEPGSGGLGLRVPVCRWHARN